jgi:hypothetical protein
MPINSQGIGSGMTSGDIARLKSVISQEKTARGSSFGGSTRASLKKVTVTAASQDTQVTGDVLTLLLSNQTGYGGFTLRNMQSIVGTVSGTAKLIPVYDYNGTIYYIPGYPAYT